MFKSFAALALRRFCCLDMQFKNLSTFSDITKIWFTPLKDSPWITPCQIHFIENGQKKNRDIIKVYDAILVMLYNISRKKLIYVQQFRPAVYYGLITGNTFEIPKGNADLVKFPPALAITLEPCAGVIDKGKSFKNIAREEVLEECGYDVPADSFELIYEYTTGIGATSCALTLLYCEVCDEQKVSEGGGIDDEIIQVVELSIADAQELVKTGSKVNGGPASLLGTLWFLANKA